MKESLEKEKDYKSGGSLRMTRLCVISPPAAATSGANDAQARSAPIIFAPLFPTVFTIFWAKR